MDAEVTIRFELLLLQCKFVNIQQSTMKYLVALLVAAVGLAVVCADPASDLYELGKE